MNSNPPSGIPAAQQVGPRDVTPSPTEFNVTVLKEPSTATAFAASGSNLQHLRQYQQQRQGYPTSTVATSTMTISPIPSLDGNTGGGTTHHPRQKAIQSAMARADADHPMSRHSDIQTISVSSSTSSYGGGGHSTSTFPFKPFNTLVLVASTLAATSANDQASAVAMAPVHVVPSSVRHDQQDIPSTEPTKKRRRTQSAKASDKTPTRKKKRAEAITTGGGNKVCLRCRFCKGTTGKATIWPRSLNDLYLKIVHFPSDHLNTCPSVPQAILDKLQGFKDTRGRKIYWSKSAKKIGLDNLPLGEDGRAVGIGIGFAPDNAQQPRPTTLYTEDDEEEINAKVCFALF